jgi:hypothetical protein
MARLVEALRSGVETERTEAHARLVAAGERAAEDLLRALPDAAGVQRRRVLAVLDELGALPADVTVAERTDLLLWRLRGGAGGPSASTRALATLRRMDADVRGELERRARGDGADRDLALFALSHGDRAQAGETRADGRSR